MSRFCDGVVVRDYKKEHAPTKQILGVRNAINDSGVHPWQYHHPYHRCYAFNVSAAFQPLQLFWSMVMMHLLSAGIVITLLPTTFMRK
jgi:hypothetical protein